ncbi:unnamed protein product [Calicophoron daubneyi]|uniref:Uncharacterized protein n=1 Tax=Calicophoron daubneyi TaxID=300641 RepID=A0AAV2TIB7_CALDB
MLIDLDNGLRAVLVSCPTVKGPEDSKKENVDDNAAATVCVETGSFSDPEDAQGLSHLLSRVLLKGSAKNPDIDEFNAFVSSNGGHSGSYCTNEYTVYFFEVEESKFKEALDRFANHFISPLIGTRRVTQCIDEMDKDFKRYKTKDQMAMQNFVCSLANEGSPFRKFNRGNKKSLLEKHDTAAIHSMLVNHFKANYSADKMTLVVQCSQTLDEMESIVRGTFGAVPRNGQTIEDIIQDTKTFCASNFEKYYEVLSNGAKEQLRLIWPLSCLQTAYRSNPIFVISSLIRNMQEGSLAHYLDENHLATDVDCDFGAISEFTNTKICTLFIVRMNLAENGSRHVNDICGAVYDYLKYLASEAKISVDSTDQDNWELVWSEEPHNFTTYVKELQVTQEHKFITRPNFSAAVSSAWIAVALTRVAPKDVYTGYVLIEEPNFQQYYDLLRYLSTEQACIIHSVLDFKTDAEATVKEPSTEQWYGTKYTKSDIPEQIVTRRMADKPVLKFSMPAKDKLAYENFLTLPCSNGSRKPENLNATVHRNKYQSFGSLWYLPIYHFESPTATFMVHIKSEVSLDSAVNTDLFLLLVEEVRYNMNKLKQEAKSLRIHYDIRAVHNAIELKVAGRSEGLRAFYYKLIEEGFPSAINMDMEEYSEIESTVKNNINREMTSLQSSALNMVNYMSIIPSRLLTDQIQRFEELTIADLLAFNSQLMSQLRITAYGTGQIEEEDVKAMYDHTVHSLECLEATTARPTITLSIPAGTHYYKAEASDPYNNNSYYVRYNLCYQTDAQSEVYNMILLELFSKQIVVFFRLCEFPNVNASMHYRLAVAGEKGHTALIIFVQVSGVTQLDDQLANRTAAFWYRIAPLLIASLTESDLKKILDSVAKGIREKYAGQTAYTKGMWNLILEHNANFDWPHDLENCVKEVTRDQLIQFFYSQYLDPEVQRTLCVQVAPRGPNSSPMKWTSIFRRSDSDANKMDVKGAQSHVTKYIEYMHMDTNGIEQYADIFHSIDAIYPERVKPVRDIQNFRSSCSS